MSEESGPAQEVEFVSSRKSKAMQLRWVIWPAIAFGLLPGFLAKGFSTGLLVSALTLFGLAGLMHWLIVRNLRPGRRVALLDAQGIESPAFSTRIKRYEWADVAAAGLQTVGRQRVVQLQLRPAAGRKDRRAFWTGVNPARPHIPLLALADEDQERLVELVLARAGSQSPTAPANELREERLFKQRLEELAPRPWVTWMLAALNVGVWAAMAAAGANGVRADASVLLDWGGNSAFQVVEHGEWWRLLTAAFLHGGMIHLAMNMLGLLSAGPTVERLYGRWQYALIYFGAALVGSGLSLHFSAQKAVSVGASGAIFGVAAAMLVGLHRHRRELPKTFAKQTLGGLGFFILYSLLQGFVLPGIDNAAHVGGLVAGGLLAWLLPRQLDPDRFQRLVRQRTQVGLAFVTLAVAALVLGATPGVDQRQLFASLQSLQQGLRAAEAANRELVREQAEVKAGRMTELQLDERTRTVHAPRFRRAMEQLQDVKLPPDDPRTAFVADSLRMMQLATELLAMDSDIVDGKPVPARPERHAVAQQELLAVGERLKAHTERLKNTRR